MKQNRQNPGWPKWLQIGIPVIALVGIGVAGVLLKYDNGNTRTGLDAFDALYSGRIALTEKNFDNSFKVFAAAAQELGAPDKYHATRSQERPDNRRTHDVAGFVRRRGQWFRESFTFKTVRHGEDQYSAYSISPLGMNDAQLKSKYGEPPREPES
jgi:hypothetical protein